MEVVSRLRKENKGPLLSNVIMCVDFNLSYFLLNLKVDDPEAKTLNVGYIFRISRLVESYSSSEGEMCSNFSRSM